MSSPKTRGAKRGPAAAPSSSSSSSAKFKRTPLRILCFGDSLTSGYPSSMPYSIQLRLKLAAAFPHHEIHIDVEGVPGDQVVNGTFTDRMETAWKIAQRDRELYDWTIILGGTNDLGWGQSVENICAGLEKCWNYSLVRKSKVLALTIPETKSKPTSAQDKRAQVNEFIKNYKRNNYFYHDLHASIPYHSLSPATRGELWNPDGLHMSSAGYDRMGSKIADDMIRLIRLQEATETEISSLAMDARQRRAVEDLIMEEERGDPKLLSQGYIYVRRADLD